MKSLDLTMTRQDCELQIQEALKNDDRQAYSEAMGNMMAAIGQEIRAEMSEQIAESKQDADRAVLAARGVRQLTSEELKFYQAFGEAIKSQNPKQALDNLPVILPETVITAVFDELHENHPLLSKINFMPTNAAVKILMNTNGREAAAWGKLCDEIVKEILGGFKEVDTGLCKLSAFLPVCKSALELGPEWLDRFVRETLYEAFANGLEYGIVTGTGADMPIGMDRQVGEGVTVVDGVYPKKELIEVSALDIKTMGNLLSLLAVNESGKSRVVRDLIMVVNPADRYSKVDPAIMIMAPDGSWRKALPYSFDIIESPAVTIGEAIFGMANRYFAALGSPKQGRIEYSDHYQFLEDDRVYLIKGFATGLPMDNKSFLRIDISGLEAPVFKFENVTHVPSDDATLASLKIGALTLSPAFDPDEDTYTAATTNAKNTVTGVVNNAAASLKVEVNDVEVQNGSQAEWTAGENEVVFTVTAEDGTTKAYTVTVTKS